MDISNLNVGESNGVWIFPPFKGSCFEVGICVVSRLWADSRGDYGLLFLFLAWEIQLKLYTTNHP